MRDLASRLRAIVTGDRLRESVPRETTDSGSQSRVDAATQLGGSLQGPDDGAYVVVERVWEPDEWHGRRQVGSYAMDGTTPLGLFDPRLAAMSDWASRVVFFDIETTGLSGGAGTVAFLAGCGWFEAGAFRVRQFFLSGPSGETAMLDALAQVFREASLLVTFNGRTFDLPVMDMRWAFHRKPTPTDALPHFDMLPPARRLWSRCETPNCSLSSLERSILGFHRTSDVPGFEIPTRYFQFLRTGDAALVEGVLAHNRHDLLSLAAITSHALKLASDGPHACRQPGEQVGLGRLYERAGDTTLATRAYELAAASADGEMRTHALARLAVLLRREERHDESVAAWQGVLDRAALTRRPLTTIERSAAQALAIHHEHRARDLETARHYAELLRRDDSRYPGGHVRPARDTAGPARKAAETAHRLGRLNRKIAANTKGGPKAAPLLTES